MGQQRRPSRRSLDLAHEHRCRVPSESGGISLAQPVFDRQFSTEFGDDPREADEAEGLPGVAEIAIRLRAVDGGTDGIAVADGDAFVRHGGELSERFFVGEKSRSSFGHDPLRRSRLAENLAHVLVKISRDEEGVNPVALLSEPLVGLFGVDVLAERTHCALAFDRLPVTRTRDEGRQPSWRTVMDDCAELTGTPIHLDTEALSRIAFRRQGLSQDERSGQGKAVAALLTGEGDGPHISPRLRAADLRVDVGHFVGVPLANLAQDEADVVDETAACVHGVPGPEGQIRLASPVAEREVREKLTRECGNG